MQQQGSKYLPSDPHGPRGWGQKVKIRLCSGHGHVAYKIKGNHACSSMIANILATDSSPLTIEMGSLVQISTFSEQGHAAYQIKGNHKIQQQQHGRKCFARRPLPHHPTTPGDGVKGITSAAATIGMGSKRSKFNIIRTRSSSVLHKKIKGITKCSNMVANILPADPPPPPPADPGNQ